MRSNACSRVGWSSRCRQCRCFHTAAFDRSPFFMLSSTMPTRRFVPPTSAARMASWPASTQLGASCTAPIRPALSGWLVMVRSSIVTPSPASNTAARPIASSPIWLALNPPPTTMRSVPCHSFKRRKRRTTVASSTAYSSTTVWTRPAARGSAPASILSSFDLEISWVGVSPKGSSPCARSFSRQSSRMARKARPLARSPTKPSSSRSSSL